MSFSKWRKLSDINCWGIYDILFVRCMWCSRCTNYWWYTNIYEISHFQWKKIPKIKMRCFDFCKKKVHWNYYPSKSWPQRYIISCCLRYFIYLSIIEYRESFVIILFFMNRWLKVAIREAIQWFTHCMPNCMTSAWWDYIVRRWRNTIYR